MGNPAYLQPSSKISISAWIKTSAITNIVVIRKRTYGYGLSLDSSGRATFFAYENSASSVSVAGTNALNNGQWVNIVAVYDGTSSKIYINGILDKTTNGSGTNQIYYGSGAIAIGRDGDNPSSYFNGQINDLRVYDHALSQKEINDLAKAKILHYTFNKDENTIYDNTGYKRHGGKVNSPVFITEGLGNSGYEFPSTKNSYITYPTSGNISPRDALTLNIWLKRTTAFNQNQDMFLITKPSAWFFYDSYATGNIYGDVIIDGIRRGAVVTSLPFDGKWYMITFTYNSTTKKTSIYKNGILSQEVTLSGLTNYLIDSSSSSFSVCGQHTLGRGMMVSDIQVYSTALSSNDILDLYQTRVKLDNQGNLYANEIIEDYELQRNLNLQQLFENNNLFLNNNFTNGITNWTITGTSSYTIQNNRIRLYANGTSYLPIITQNLTITSGRKYYFRSWFNTNDTTNTKMIRTNTPYLYFYNTVSVGNDYTSSVVSPTSNYTLIEFFLNGYTNHIPLITEWFEIGEVFLIDLTTIFGSGNEPTKEQMDSWYSIYVGNSPKLTLRSLFEDKNRISNWRTSTDSSSYSSVVYNSENDYLVQTGKAGQTVFSNALYPSISMPTGTKVYTRYDYYLPSSQNLTYTTNRIRIFSATPGDTYGPNSPADTWLSVSTVVTLTAEATAAPYFQATTTSSIENKYRYVKGFYQMNLTELFGSGYEPTQAQLDAWYKDYITSRPKSSGIMRTKEFNEVGIDTIVYEGKTYREIFETNNLIINGDFKIDTNSDGLADYWSVGSASVLSKFLDEEGQNWTHDGTSAYSRSISQRDIINTANTFGDYFYYAFENYNINGHYISDDIVNTLVLGNPSNGLYSNILQNTISNNDFRLSFYPGNDDTRSSINNVYMINITDTFTTVPTKAQMDSMYQKYRQLKTTNQKLRIAKDMIIIDGSIKEG